MPSFDVQLSTVIRHNVDGTADATHIGLFLGSAGASSVRCKPQIEQWRDRLLPCEPLALDCTAVTNNSGVTLIRSRRGGRLGVEMIRHVPEMVAWRDGEGIAHTSFTSPPHPDHGAVQTTNMTWTFSDDILSVDICTRVRSDDQLRFWMNGIPVDVISAKSTHPGLSYLSTRWPCDDRRVKLHLDADGISEIQRKSQEFTGDGASAFEFMGTDLVKLDQHLQGSHARSSLVTTERSLAVSEQDLGPVAWYLK